MTPDTQNQPNAAAGELPTKFDPASTEPPISRLWDEADAFRADPNAVLDGSKKPYCIIIPPPNVTARLHLGHALNTTLQDVLVRYHRLRGYETLWMPGTDHAGIATQTAVDKALKSKGAPALADYKRMEAAGQGGREKFEALVLDWAQDFEGQITEQFKLMGASCDWKRQRFTMDPVCARAVREAFFRLFKAGLIYRGKRLVNWDPVTQTALADDEVESKEIDGAFYYLRYPLIHPSGSGDHSPVTWGELAAKGHPGAEAHTDDEQAWVTVATTRPETYLGDVAVAMNPHDPRLASLRGLLCELPLVGRRIPIIEDSYVVMPVSLGGDENDAKAQMATGFLKVTPAHDPNDYEIGQRHKDDILARCSAGEWLINVMAPDASISSEHGWPDFGDHTGAEVFVGLSREDARKKVVAEFKARTVAEGDEGSLLEAVKPHRHAVGHSYRSHVPIEPYLSDQWYCRVTDDRLRGAAQRALNAEQRTDESLDAWPESKAGDSANESSMTFFPSRYAKTYEGWHDHLRDWCISRQLWWGHRIPVWSGPAFPLGTKQDTRESRSGLVTQVIEFDDPDHHLHAVQEEPGPGELRVHIALSPDAPPEWREALEQQGFRRDPDVLDTWFSSALWPLSTMGWPDADAAAADTSVTDFPALLDAFNPSSVLCTAREIITLWVSRMAMFNRFFRDEAGEGAGPPPFAHVFIHALIMDGEGRKMSKTLGNGVDPWDIIRSHGADAMRFTLAQMTTQTQDVRMPVVEDPETGRNTSPKFDTGRNFCNKVWNAARFTISILERAGAGEAVSADALGPADRWMMSRLARATAEIERCLSEYRYAEGVTALYDLIWRDYCDWYLEAIKPTVNDDPGQRAALTTALSAILRLLHPVCPFLTEAIYQRLSELNPVTINGVTLTSDTTLCRSGWPEFVGGIASDEAEGSFEQVRDLVGAIREVRAQHTVPPKRRVRLHAPKGALDSLGDAAALVEHLAMLEPIDGAAPPDGAVAFRVGDHELSLSSLADAVDAGAERERLTKLIGDLEKSANALGGRLNNPGYVDKAPAALVEETRQQLARTTNELEDARKQLSALG